MTKCQEIQEFYVISITDIISKKKFMKCGEFNLTIILFYVIFFLILHRIYFYNQKLKINHNLTHKQHPTPYPQYHNTNQANSSSEST